MRLYRRGQVFPRLNTPHPLHLGRLRTGKRRRPRMLTAQVALVSELPAITHSDLTRVAAALQKQVARDFGPIWSVHATVDAFVTLDDVPLGYWPIIIEQNIHQAGAAG